MNAKSSFISKAIVWTAFLLLFGEAYGTTLIGNTYRLIFIGILAILLFVDVVVYKSIRIYPQDQFPLRCSIFAIILILASYLCWDFTHNIYSYLGIPLAFLIYTIDFKEANKLIIYTAILTLVLTFYEYITNRFLFVNIIHGEEINEHIMGGASQTFRAKGLFFGPTVLGVFFVFACFINNRNLWLFLISFIACFFANSRTGLVVLSIPFLFLLVKKRNIKYAFLLLCIFIICFFLINQISPEVTKSITRITELTATGNQEARVYFWTTGIQLYGDYSLPNLIFGNNGYYNSIFHNNPESGWICLLTDNGLVGFLFYLTPLLYCLHKFLVRRDTYYLIIVLSFIFLNFIITAHLSGTNNLLYWLLVFELYNQAKYGHNKANSCEKEFVRITKTSIGE